MTSRRPWNGRSATSISRIVNVKSFESSTNSEPNVALRLVDGAVLNAGGDITIHAAHNVAQPRWSDGTFDAGTQVDEGGSNISFTLPHGSSDGDVVTYNAQLSLSGNAAIGGLEDQRQYSVIVTDDKTLQLGASFQEAQVNPVTDAIEFGSFVPMLPASIGFQSNPGTAPDAIHTTGRFVAAGLVVGDYSSESATRASTAGTTRLCRLRHQRSS